MKSGTALAQAQEAMRVADVDPGSAFPVAARAVRLARQERDPAAAATAERAWGHALLQCGEMDSAIRHLRRATDLGQRAGSPVLAGQARMELAYALSQRGRPQSALREVDAAIRSLDGVAGARARAQRAVILHQIGRMDEALAECHSVLPTLRAGEDLLGVQRTLVNRGILLAERHAFAAAEADLWEADTLARKLGRRASIGIIAENLGLVEALRGDVPAALAHFDRAERIQRDHGIQLGPIWHDRSELLLSVGLVAEAREAAERAVEAFRRDHRQLKVSEVRLLLAQAAYLDGDWPTALRQARRAARELARQERAEWAALARVTALRTQLAAGQRPRVDVRQVEEMVAVLALTGWPAAALEARLVAARLVRQHGGDGRAHLLQASRAARRRGPAVLRARGWYAEALLRLDLANPRGAVAAARAGLRVLDEHSSALGATDLRAHAAAHRTDLVDVGLGVALRSGRPGRVFEWAERSRARQLLHRPVRPPGDPELAGLLAELRATTVEVDKLGRAGRGAARLGQRQVALEQRIRDHGRLRRGESAAPLPGPVSVARLGQALGERVLVEFVQVAEAVYALTVVDGRLRMRALGLVAEVAALVERLPFALHRLARRGAGAESRSAAAALLGWAAERLDAALLRPLAGLGDRPLVVVPTGPLHSLPWSVLPSCAGRPVAVSPSATLWHSTMTRASPPTAAGAATVTVAAGPELSGAREEACAVATIHRTTALLDGAASADAVLAGLARSSLAHLAAHGRLSSDNPLFSDLLLADGPLVVYDVERLDRVPHTVVLAACDSARSMVCPGDELLGLSATFIARGTAQLVASVVPVPDAETAPLMVAFHRLLAGGELPAVALAVAQRQLADEDPAARAAAAGFVCIGAGFSAPQLPP